ncbi:MAG TPA: SIS domain-containing protein, partial [Anaerolineales bacterium]
MSEYNLDMLKDTHLYKEIHEQPQVLSALIERELRHARELAAAMRERDVQLVVIAARGSSDNAARYANYLLGSMNGLVVSLATPSLFTIYQRPPSLGRALVLGISQSGKSPDIVAVLAEARRQGALTAAITNALASDLARQADHVIDLGAGVERSVAATKTYTSALLAIALLSACLSDGSEMLDALQRVPQAAVQTLDVEGQVAGIVQRYRYMHDCVVIGRGYNYATAFELALKLKELTYTMVEPYSSAD